MKTRYAAPLLLMLLIGCQNGSESGSLASDEAVEMEGTRYEEPQALELEQLSEKVVTAATPRQAEPKLIKTADVGMEVGGLRRGARTNQRDRRAVRGVRRLGRRAARLRTDQQRAYASCTLDAVRRLAQRPRSHSPGRRLPDGKRPRRNRRVRGRLGAAACPPRGGGALPCPAGAGQKRRGHLAR